MKTISEKSNRPTKNTRSFHYENMSTLSKGSGKEKKIIAFEKPTLQSKPLAIGSRRELFVDNYIIGALRGGVRRHLFEMTPATTEREDVAISYNANWENFRSRFAKYIRDGDVIKSWYTTNYHTGQVCYAISRDGQQFSRPDLGTFKYRGSMANNILLNKRTFKAGKRYLLISIMNVFIDTNPAAKLNEKYKAIVGDGHKALWAKAVVSG